MIQCWHVKPSSGLFSNKTYYITAMQVFNSLAQRFIFLKVLITFAQTNSKKRLTKREADLLMSWAKLASLVQIANR